MTQQSSILCDRPPRRRESCAARAFTLAEIIVATIILAFLAGATTLALSQSARARDASLGRLEAHLRAESAASRIAQDVENTIRDTEVFFTRLLVTDGPGAAGMDRDSILLYARSTKLVRPRAEQGEGGEYEVQYRLQPSPPLPAGQPAQPGAARREPPPTAYVLWRRCDPVPDEVYDGGGVAAAIVDGVTSLSILASDGNQWFKSWDSDNSGYPHAVSITVTAADNAGRYTATVRRVVALDRTPLPVNPVDTSTTSGSSGTTGSTSAGGGGR
jgi:hypothetical protein